MPERPGPGAIATTAESPPLDDPLLVGRAVRPLDPPDRSRPLPLSGGQQQMWVLNQLDPASPAYLMSWVLRLTGPLDIEGLRWAWGRVVERHEVLRTRYAHAADGPIQLVDPPGRFDLRTVDLSGHDPSDVLERARRIAERERRTPVDLTLDHPVRVTLLRLDVNLHWCVVVIHHIACDDVSFRIVARELGAFYAQHTTGVAADLPEAPPQYADYACWERDRRSSGELRPQLAYWRQRLAGLTDLQLPYDAPRPERPDMRGGVVEIPISPRISMAIKDLAGAGRATPAMVLLAVLHATLAPVTGSADVAVGLPVTARTRPEMDAIVGYVVNIVVVRSDCTGDRTFLELLDEVRTHAFDALDHRDIPFAAVVDELRPARGAAVNPLFRVAFDMNVSDADAFELPGVEVEHLELPADPVAKFDLNLHVEESSTNQFRARLEYAAALFTKATVDAFAAGFERLLGEVLADPAAPLAALWQGAAQVQALRRPANGVDSEHVSATPTMGRPAAVDAVRAQIDAAWRAALKVEQVGPYENFFDVGGDSLLAVSVAAGLKAEGLDVTAADIFAHQTIEDLAQAVAGRAGIEAGVGGVAPFALVSPADKAVLPPGVVDAYPLAMAQLGMIVEMRARPEASRYQDTTSFLIKDAQRLDIGALQAAAQLVVDRHATLRTSFDLSSYSIPLQLVHASADITVGHTEHGTVRPSDWRPILLAYAAEQRRIPFDLAEPPLLRIHAHVAANDSDWWLSLTECHPTVEGWSFHQLLIDILTCYQDIRAGRRPVDPPAVAFRYADHVAAEAAALRSTSDRAYWGEVLRGRVPVFLPSTWQGDRDLPDERYQHLVPFRDIEDRLRALATRTRTSLKAVLLAAHLKVMDTVMVADNFFTGLVCDARPEVVGAERVPGMYLNTVPFAMPAGATTWGELIAAVYDGLAEMWPHRHLPLQVIQQEHWSDNRLLDVIFNYLDFHHVDKQLLDWDATVTETDNEFALHVFTISGLVKLNTTTHLLSRENAGRLGALYRAVLERMAEGPDGDAAALCLPANEKTRLDALSVGRRLDGEPESVLALFEAWVTAQPDALAVRGAEIAITYRELDAAADRLADRLRMAGAGRGELVAVAAADVRMPTVMLGVWKVGAAWLPVRSDGSTVDLSGLTARGIRILVTTEPDAPDGIAVVETHRGNPLGSSPRPAPGSPPDLRDEIACVLPARGHPTSSGAVITHRSLAYAVAGLAAALADRAVPPGPTATWASIGPAPSWTALADAVLPLATGGQLAIGAPAHPTGPSAGVDAARPSYVRVTPLLAERLTTSPPAADGLVTLLGGDLRAPVDPVTSQVPGELPALGLAELAGWAIIDGRPVPGLTARILDDRHRAVPAGVYGELTLAGPALATGYLDDPVGTAERLVPDPDGPPGARMLRTGQIARWGADGRLERLGDRRGVTRPDGRLLDLAHVRAELCRASGMAETVVLLRDDQRGERQLVAYIRATGGDPVDAVGLRRQVAARLPRRLVPDALVRVDAWPVTAAGELDVGALPGPAVVPERASARERWDEQFEALLRGVLRFLPPEEPLRPDLELTAVGLDSLGTVELLTGLEEAYDIVIPDEMLAFETFATAGSLWEQIVRLRADAGAGEPS